MRKISYSDSQWHASHAWPEDLKIKALRAWPWYYTNDDVMNADQIASQRPEGAWMIRACFRVDDYLRYSVHLQEKECKIQPLLLVILVWQLVRKKSVHGRLEPNLGFDFRTSMLCSMFGFGRFYTSHSSSLETSKSSKPWSTGCFNKLEVRVFNFVFLRVRVFVSPLSHLIVIRPFILVLNDMRNMPRSYV